MARASLKVWLLQHVRLKFWVMSFGALGGLLLGLLVTLLTYWIIYGVIAMTFGAWFDLSGRVTSIISGVIVVMLFVGNATTERSYLDQIELDLGPGRHIKVAVARATGHSWMMAFSDAKQARASVKMLTTLLYTGPRTIVGSYELFQQARGLKNFHVDECRRILSLLLTTGRRVPFSEIAEKHPKLDLAAALTDLRLINGVVFLSSEPAGLTVSPGLVDDISAWKQKMREIETGDS